MLTIFSMPKPFREHSGIIQRNALTSWTLLKPRPEIILFGNEEGTTEACEELDLRHGPEVLRNEFRTPLLDDLFEKAYRLARYELLCYVNADIILLSDFSRAVEQVRLWPGRFLMIGRRWDVNIGELWNFESDGYEEQLRSLTLRSGEQRDAWWIDYFVFRRGLFASIPPFAIGRMGYDNWLIWKATKQKAAIIDATPLVTAIHQNHDYSHVRLGKNLDREEGFRRIQEGEEARRNRELAGGRDHFYNVLDATHRLTPSGIRRDLSVERLRRRLKHFRRHVKRRRRSLVNRAVDFAQRFSRRDMKKSW